MSAVVDSVIWIAAKYPRDKWHTQVTEISSHISQLEKIYIVEGILVEVANFLVRRVSSGVAHSVVNDLLNSPHITLLENNTVTRIGTLDIMIEIPGLSYTDANIVWHLRQLDCKTVISFDHGFDQVRGIERKYLLEHF